MNFFSRILASASFSFLLMSCGNPQDAIFDEQSLWDAERQEQSEQSFKPQGIQYEVKIADSNMIPSQQNKQVSFDNKIVESDNVALAVQEHTQIDPVAPSVARRGFLAGAHEVDPSLANYVNSYGVLPTRYAKDGPFLYSLDVHPHTSEHLAGSK
ncbi:MAG: hypothetical protein KC505_00080 [Myxococcales bacterium]|nr:hypothetical protein [Myxococcales bacterium]USN50485.1 MAG: hypothetical protein H6731_09515 [Myxococcales bacterium]